MKTYTYTYVHRNENKRKTVDTYVFKQENRNCTFVWLSVLSHNLFLNYNCQIILICSKKEINYLDTDNQIAHILPL